jgi:hypothetical protein
MANNKLKKKKAEEQVEAFLAKRAKAFRDPKSQEGVRLIRPANEDPFLNELANQLNKSAHRKVN